MVEGGFHVECCGENFLEKPVMLAYFAGLLIVDAG